MIYLSVPNLLCERLSSIKLILWLTPPIINLDRSSSIMLAGNERESRYEDFSIAWPRLAASDSFIPRHCRVYYIPGFLIP